jgi:hypothetical protein
MQTQGYGSSNDSAYQGGGVLQQFSTAVYNPRQSVSNFNPYPVWSLPNAGQQIDSTAYRNHCRMMNTLHTCFTMSHDMVAVHGNIGFQKLAPLVNQIVQFTTEAMTKGILGVQFEEPENSGTTNILAQDGNQNPVQGPIVAGGQSGDRVQRNEFEMARPTIEDVTDEDECQFIDHVPEANGPGPSLRPRSRYGLPYQSPSDKRH